MPNPTKNITLGRALRSARMTLAGAVFVALGVVSADAWPAPITENFNLTVNFQNASGAGSGNLLPGGQITVACGIVGAGGAPSAAAIANLPKQSAAGATTVAVARNWPTSANGTTFSIPFGSSGGAAGPNSATKSFSWTYTYLVPTSGTIYCAPVSATMANSAGTQQALPFTPSGATSSCSMTGGVVSQAVGLKWPAGYTDGNAGYQSGSVSNTDSASMNVQFSNGCPFLGKLSVVGNIVPGGASGSSQTFTATAKLVNAQGAAFAGQTVGWGQITPTGSPADSISGTDHCADPNGKNGSANYPATTGSDGTVSVAITCTHTSQAMGEQGFLMICSPAATNCVTWKWPFPTAPAGPVTGTLTMNVTVAGLNKAPLAGTMQVGCGLTSGNGPPISVAAQSVKVGPAASAASSLQFSVPNVTFSAFYYATCVPTAFSSDTSADTTTLKNALNMSTSSFATQEVPTTNTPMTFTVTAAWGGPIVTPPPAAAYCCGPAGITLFSSGGVTNATSESAALTGASSTGTFAKGIGGTATFGDVIFIVDDAKGNRVPAGTVVTFKATGTGTNGGPIACNVPASAKTVGIDSNGGQVTLHGATATGWPGTCTVTASSSAASGSPSVTMNATYTGTLPASGTLMSGVQPLSQADLAWFQQPGNISIYSDVNTTQDPNSSDIDKDTPFYHDVCPMKNAGPSGIIPDTNFNAFGIRMNIGVKWPSDWKSTQLLQLVYNWNTSGGRASNPTQTWLLSPATNGTPLGSTNFISGLSLYPTNSIQSQWFQVSVTSLNGTSVTIKQNDLSGKVGVAITAGCYHGGPPASTSSSGAAIQ